MGEGWDIIVEFVAEVEDIFDVSLWLWSLKRIDKILCFSFASYTDSADKIFFLQIRLASYVNVFELHDKILDAVKPFGGRFGFCCRLLIMIIS